ncbi:MAG: YihY/virulence factor BrkB family protein [Roseicyclus sp.]|nr:YihY/virulence factor BrkB family protein [Roseicyclus sp.]MBO6623731.1 YihY/virulence factor BrkB family protein [Roseicyclus sp.]MBO6922816.1 YihY/virulence factor BrkB family protein [Roseicyclus sp.]
MKIVPRHRWPVWWAVSKRVFAQIDRKNLGLISAGVAFYGILAIFPAITAVIAIWGLIGDPRAIMPQLEAFRAILPEDVFTLLGDQISALASASTDSLGLATILSILLALWSTRAGVAALMRGMNAVYDERNRRGLAHYASAFGLTVALILVALISIASVVVTPFVLAILPLGTLAALALEVVRWLVAIGVLLAGTGLVYRYGPNRRGARLPWITPGAVLAVTIWAAASAGFSLYLSNFGNYNEVYGSIGAVIALLIWLFISGFLLLLGAAFNAELERHTKMDSTVGPDRPIGERGAVVADTYKEV